MTTTFWSALILLAILVISLPVMVVVLWVTITWSSVKMKASRFIQNRPVRIRGVIATLKSPSGDEIY